MDPGSTPMPGGSTPSANTAAATKQPMIYVCGGRCVSVCAHTNRSEPTLSRDFLRQTATARTRLDRRTPSVAESAATVSCTRRGRKEVRKTFAHSDNDSTRTPLRTMLWHVAQPFQNHMHSLTVLSFFFPHTFPVVVFDAR